MQTDHVVPLPDGRTMRATLAVPSGDAPEGGWPGVLVVHEVFGWTQEIADVADTFAARGWVAVVPDVFSAGTRIGCLVRSLREVQAGTPGPVTDDLHSVLAWLQGRDEVDGARTATIGFCMGGAFALLLGTLGPDGLRAVSDNYGLVTGENADLAACPPVIGSFGDDDVLAGKVATPLRRELDAAGVVNDVVSYPGAKHSFLTGNHRVFGILPIPGTAYVESVATPAWQRIFRFLDEHVRA
ncbi:dienelactone hydrolase family protein [Rhodococcus aerolatus]